jgi:hypothetical protein
VRSIFEAASLDATGALRGITSGHERLLVMTFFAMGKMVG